MTPKEKAKELIEKYWFEVNDIAEDSISWIQGNECALIAVDELIESTFSKEWYNNNDIIPADYLLTDYWEEVKQEIEKM